MKGPSLTLSTLADRIDGFADKVEEFEGWISGFRIWKYPGLTRQLEEAKERNRELIEDYHKLVRLYEEKTGERAPWSAAVFVADLRPLREALSETGRKFLKIANPS